MNEDEYFWDGQCPDPIVLANFVHCFGLPGPGLLWCTAHEICRRQAIDI